jgi:hypothetical protein
MSLSGHLSGSIFSREGDIASAQNLSIISFKPIKCKLNYSHVIIRDYYMTFSISALVLTRDSYIKPDSEAGGLIWVEGWYQGPYGKFHVIIFLSHILHWPFPSIDFYFAKKIYEQRNCENKSLRELPLFNLQIFLFESGFKNIPNNVDLYNDVRNCL